jgi:uncharacterized phage protein (TIGR01671 family)
MRTIKYRAFLKREKIMLPVISLDYDYKGEGILVDVITINPSGDPEADSWENNLEDVELMQFTGLTDVNGTEIYEGDIIIGHYPINDTRSSLKGFVEYSEVMGAFYLGQEREIVMFKDGPVIGKTNSVDWLFLFSEIEVIGNRFENPELL